MTTVLIVEDHVFSRRGLGQYLQSEGFTTLEASDAESAFALAQQWRPDAAILDIVIPSRAGAPLEHEADAGLDLARRLKTRTPSPAVLLLSSHPDRGQAFFELLNDGFRGLGYLIKSGNPEHVLDGLRRVLEGHVIFDQQVRSRRVAAEEIAQRLTAEERPWVERVLAQLSRLTEREWEVVRLVTQSYDTRGIAQRLSLQPKTVEHYVTQVYDKLDLSLMLKAAPRLRQAHILTKACLIYELQRGKLG